MTTYNTGNPVPSGDAKDRFDNSQTFDEVINSQEYEAETRLGAKVKTLKWMEDAALAIPAIAAADRAEGEADRAKLEADRSKSYADLALTLSGTYADTASGIAATTPDQVFGVPVANDPTAVILYANIAGVAVDTGARLPSTLAIEALLTLPARVEDLETALPTSVPALLLMSFGQSNATRWTPRMTFAYPPNLLTFSGATESVDRTDGLNPIGNTLGGAVYSATAPYTEFGQNKEGYAAGFSIATPIEYGAILTHTPAVGGYQYRLLMSGKEAWTNLSNALRLGRKHLLASGYRKIDTLVLWDHGEADGTAGVTQAEYVDVLKDLTSNIFATSRMMLQSPAATPTLMGVQPCTNTSIGARNVKNAHLEASRTIGGYHLAGPRYAFEYETDGTHIKATGKRRFAEYLALRHQDIVSGEAMLPVHAVTATRAGAVITATFSTISGDLVIDTGNVPNTAAAYPGSLYGIEYYYADTQVPVSSVTVAGKVMTITLASPPADAGELRIAQMASPAGTMAVSGPNSKLVRSCIRDSGSRLAKYDNAPLYNWACHQTIATN